MHLHHMKNAPFLQHYNSWMLYRGKSGHLLYQIFRTIIRTRCIVGRGKFGVKNKSIGLDSPHLAHNPHPVHSPHLVPSANVKSITNGTPRQMPTVFAQKEALSYVNHLYYSSLLIKFLTTCHREWSRKKQNCIVRTCR